ncbi:hypothetical protein NM688_g9399 [Phlebia brevispora]|uniref:Uncharacterized protein n=1 Tax=Phlebia brevispora TaxID=194682 RepID=A0ACC1RHL9_9APHY|nr:hypothetical protein NM688_g9399 [Phlebia brevispora]
MYGVATEPMLFDRSLSADEPEVGDGTTTSEWVKTFEETARRLNANDVKVFEVGPTGMLLIGDISLSVADGVPNGRADLRLAWIDPGPLDLEDLPTAESLSKAPWAEATKIEQLEKIGTANVDSGQLGIIDDDMNNAVLEAIGDEEVAAQLLTDPFSTEFVGEFALTGGYVINSRDGIYAVFAKKDGDTVVELVVKDETPGQAAEDEG